MQNGAIVARRANGPRPCPDAALAEVTINIERHDIDCAVVGAGIAGMSAAHRLAAAGHRVLVIEADRRTGGRAGTTVVEGLPVDLGFQSMFRAYPETHDLLSAIGLGREALMPLDRGAVFHDGGGLARFSLSPMGLMRFPSLGGGDLARLLRLGAEVAGRSSTSLLGGSEREMTTAEFLGRRGFSTAAIDGFFRPLFGVITFDRTLSSDAAYFRFLLSMLLRGPAVIPAEGHGMICERAAHDLRARGGEVRVGTPVEAVLSEGGRARGVCLAGGEKIAARAVVLAAGPVATARLLSPHDSAASRSIPIRSAGGATVAFVLDRPLYRGRTIVLNSAPPDGADHRVDLVCQTSNVLRPGTAGPYLLLATGVGASDGPPSDPEALEVAARELIGRWSPGFDLARHARAVRRIAHPFAQFRVTPGVRARLPAARTSLPGLALAGDLLCHPSIEGAVVGGRLAAEVVAEQLAVTH